GDGHHADHAEEQDDPATGEPGRRSTGRQGFGPYGHANLPIKRDMFATTLVVPLARWSNLLGPSIRFVDPCSWAVKNRAAGRTASTSQRLPVLVVSRRTRAGASAEELLEDRHLGPAVGRQVVPQDA